MIFSKKSALTRCALALGLVTLLNVSIEAAVKTEKDKSLFHLRPRLGYLSKSDGYLKVYEEYFKNVIQKTDEALARIDINDWRNVRPSAQLCVDFLQGFQFRNYKLNKPYEIIPLDACLNWLFDESDEKQTDLQQLNTVAKSETGRMAKDDKFKEIYASTGFKDDSIPKDLKEKLHDYFSKLLKVFTDNPKNGCHSFWLGAYNDFIEDVYLDDCDDEEQCVYFGHPGLEKDSYLNLVVESTKQSSKICYNVMLKQMTGLMHQTAYDKIKVSKSSEPLREKWSKEMTKILQLVGGGEKSVNLVKAAEQLALLKRNDEEAQERFTDAVGKYAMSKINLKETGNDADGRARFGKAMTKLCNPYIDPTSFLAQTGGSALLDEDGESKRKPFEFYHLIYSLIRLTNHVPIYGIGKEKFEEDVMRNGWQALYLATFACQLISTTYGQLDYDFNEGQYKVYLRPNSGVLIEDWPIELIASKLAAQKQPDSEPVSAAPANNPKQPVQETYDTDGSASRPTLKFKNPLRGSARRGNDLIFSRRVKPNSAGTIEEAPESSPPTPETGIPSQLDAEILEQYKALHGHYPRQKPGEELPKPDRDLDGVFPQELYTPPAPKKQGLFDTTVPLAFNFDSHFVAGKKKAESDNPAKFGGAGSDYAASRWAAMNSFGDVHEWGS